MLRTTTHSRATAHILAGGRIPSALCKRAAAEAAAAAAEARQKSDYYLNTSVWRDRPQRLTIPIFAHRQLHHE